MMHFVRVATKAEGLPIIDFAAFLENEVEGGGKKKKIVVVNENFGPAWFSWLLFVPFSNRKMKCYSQCSLRVARRVAVATSLVGRTEGASVTAGNPV